MCAYVLLNALCVYACFEGELACLCESVMSFVCYELCLYDYAWIKGELI